MVGDDSHATSFDAVLVFFFFYQIYFFISKSLKLRYYESRIKFFSFEQIGEWLVDIYIVD